MPEVGKWADWRQQGAMLLRKVKINQREKGVYPMYIGYRQHKNEMQRTEIATGLLLVKIFWVNNKLMCQTMLYSKDVSCIRALKRPKVILSSS